MVTGSAKRKCLVVFPFLYKGKMAIGVVKDSIAVRVIEDKYEDYLEKDFVKPMDFTGKPMKEFLYVEEKGFKSDSELNHWIELGIEHAESKL